MELICRAAAQADLPACCNVFADSEIYERYFSAPRAFAGCIPISRSSAPHPGPAGAAWGIFFSRSSKPWPVCKEPDALR